MARSLRMGSSRRVTAGGLVLFGLARAFSESASPVVPTQAAPVLSPEPAGAVPTGAAPAEAGHEMLPLPGGAAPAEAGHQMLPLPGGAAPAEAGHEVLPLPGGASPGHEDVEEGAEEGDDDELGPPHLEGSHYAKSEMYEATPGGKMMGYMLVGTIAFIMVIYHAVNWFQKKPRVFAWKMISATLSIFLALITMSVLQRICLALTQPVRIPAAVVEVIFFIIFSLVLQVVLFNVREHPVGLVAMGTIFGHMSAFAAIEAFVVIQEQLEENEVAMFFACAGFYIMATGSVFVGGRLRGAAVERLEEQGDEVGEKVDEWLEVCAEVEMDSATMTTGILISQVVRSPILGFLAPLEETSRFLKESQIMALLAAGLISAALMMVITHLRRKRCGGTLQERSGLLLRAAQGTVGMTTAWIFIFFGQWQYYYMFPDEDKMVIKTTLAVLTSSAMLPLLSCFSLQCVAQSGMEAQALQAVISALGLMVGLAWEKSMSFALREVIFEHNTDTRSYLWSFSIAVVVLDTVVGSAWAFFILPKADAHVHGGGPEALWGTMMEKGDPGGEGGILTSEEDSRHD